MRFQTYIPPPPLSEFVHSFRLVEDFAAVREWVLPTGTIELVIPLSTREQTLSREVRAEVCGPHSRPFLLNTAPIPMMMQVHFKAGGVFPFLRLPPGDLHNLRVSPADLWGTEAKYLEEQLMEAPSPEARFRVLEGFLVTKASQPLGRHPAVRFALRQFRADTSARRVAEVTEQVGLSSRRFIQLFTREVGLAPKLYSRVQRFQQVVNCLDGADRVNWTDLALACGYYDQAHFIRDFQALSGLLPSDYLALKTPHLNHVPLPG
jgi:AraC-like DNA-binding protein